MSDDDVAASANDDDDDDRCPMCGERAVEPIRMPMGGGMTETYLICQRCGAVVEDDA